MIKDEGLRKHMAYTAGWMDGAGRGPELDTVVSEEYWRGYEAGIRARIDMTIRASEEFAWRPDWLKSSNVDELVVKAVKRAKEWHED